MHAHTCTSPSVKFYIGVREIFCISTKVTLRRACRAAECESYQIRACHAPAGHVNHLYECEGNGMAQAGDAAEVGEGVQRVHDEGLHTVRHQLSAVRSEGRVEEVEELDSELVGGLLERHNLVLYATYLEALFAASLAPAHHLPHHHPTCTTPITTGKDSTVCTRLAVLYLHLLAAACTLPLPSQARGDEGPRWSGGEERCRYLHLLAHFVQCRSHCVHSPRPSLAHLAASGAPVAPTSLGSYTSLGQQGGSECAMAGGMKEVGLKMLGVLRHGDDALFALSAPFLLPHLPCASTSPSAICLWV